MAQKDFSGNAMKGKSTPRKAKGTPKAKAGDGKKRTKKSAIRQF